MLSPVSSTSELELTLPSSQSLETMEPQTGPTYSLPPSQLAAHLTGCGCRWRNLVRSRQISAGWCSWASSHWADVSHQTSPGSHWSETFFSEFAWSSPSSFSSHCVFCHHQHSSVLTVVSFNFNYNEPPVQSIPVRLLEKDLLRFRLELELLDTFVFRVPFLFNLSSKLFFLESFFRCVVSFLFSTAWFLPFLSLAFRGWNSIRYYDSEEPVTQPTRPNTPPVWQLGTKTDWLYLMMSESVGLKRMIIVLNWSSGVFSLSTTTMVGIGWIIVLQYSVVPLSSWQPLAKN